MDPVKIIDRYYEAGSFSRTILVEHGKAVAEKALNMARKLKNPAPDLKFIEEAALLHDFGIIMTNAPEIGCFGTRPYICHGYLGRELLEKEGFPLHALVCERHVGVGLTTADITRQNLPLPFRDMIPLSTEEQIICFADKFFSKQIGSMLREKTLEEVKMSIGRFGPENLEKFEGMLRLFQ